MSPPAVSLSPHLFCHPFFPSPRFFPSPSSLRPLTPARGDSFSCPTQVFFASVRSGGSSQVYFMTLNRNCIMNW